MHLTYRPAGMADIDPCFALLPPQFACEPGLRARLPDVWRSWLQDGRMRLTVVEDAGGAVGARRAGFGASVFVSEEFAQEAQSALPPPLSAQVARRALEGRPPILTPDQVRRANSGPGLCLLVLHIGWEPSLDAEAVRRVKAKLFEAFFFTIAGFKIECVMQEVYSPEEMERGLAIGVTLMTDYGAFYRGEDAPPPQERAYLIGASRNQVRDGSAISPMFLYSPPRFFFSSGEQDVLTQALLGEGDEDLARVLQVSPSTVHKRWRGIYERVGAVAPDLLPAAPGEGDRRRGQEKRRHLLSYLRSHPEELRPILPPEA